MKALALLPLLLVLIPVALGQASKPNSLPAGPPAAQSCVIVKRHVYKFGENMTRWHPHRPFDYVEGDYPEGYKWRSELSDGDVRDVQKKGGKVIMLRADYELADLEDARKQCKTGSAPQAQ